MSLTPSQKQRAADLWRTAVRGLFHNRCFVCGRTEPANPSQLTMFHCHHVEPKKMGGNPHIAYKLENGCLLCRSHHEQAHGPDGKLWLDQLIEDRFPEWFSLILNLRRVKPHPYTQECLELDVEKLKAVTNGE